MKFHAPLPLPISKCIEILLKSHAIFLTFYGPTCIDYTIIGKEPGTRGEIVWKVIGEEKEKNGS